MTELILTLVVITVGLFILIYRLLPKTIRRTCVNCGNLFSTKVRHIDPARLMEIEYNFCDKCIQRVSNRVTSKVIDLKEGK